MDDPERDFEYGPVSGDFTSSYVKANAECLRHGFKYAAIQGGNELFCNHEYPSYPEANPEDCYEYRCKDHPESGCGNTWRQVVLRVMQPPLGLIDCESDFGLVMLQPQLSSFSLSGPVKGWNMRATSREPQVIVSTNDVLSRCQDQDACRFYYDRDLTPVIDSVYPEEGISGELLTINFDTDHWEPVWINATTITIADIDCPVLEREDFSLTCEFGPTPSGVHHVVAHVDGIGASLLTVTFKSLLKVTKVSPSAGSVHGGTILVIEGKGFALSGPDNTITVGDVPCVPRVMDNTHCKGLKYEGFVNCNVDVVYGYSGPVERHYAKAFDFSNYERIECVVGGGNHSTAQVGLSITVGDQKKYVPDAFEFSWERTPVIYAINPNPAAQSVPILLRGYNLEADPVVDKQWYMNIWGFYERFPNVSVFLDRVDVATKTYDRQIFGKNLCFIGDVSTEDRMGKHQQWSETNGTHITCTIGDIKPTTYPVHVYIHGKGFAHVKETVTVGVVVRRVEPKQVSIYAGVPITISGSGFSRFNSHNKVSLGSQKCHVTKATATKIVCHPSAPGKQYSGRIKVSVVCGNLAFCNSEPQPSTGKVWFHFKNDITPTLKLSGIRQIMNPAIGASVAPGSLIKMQITMPVNQMIKHQSDLMSIISVRLGGTLFTDLELVSFNNKTGSASLQGRLPNLAIGTQRVQAKVPTGNSAKSSLLVFPHVGTPDVSSVGVGGGLVVTLRSPGIGGWIENGRTPRAAMVLIHDGTKFTTSNCYPQHNVRWDKRLGPLLDMSWNKCTTFCNDYRYFGVHDGETCVCSNKTPTRAALRNKCNKQCSSDFNRRGNICGGNWYITLFERCCRTDVYLAPVEYTQNGGLSPWTNWQHKPLPGLFLIAFMLLVHAMSLFICV